MSLCVCVCVMEFCGSAVTSVTQQPDTRSHSPNLPLPFFSISCFSPALPVTAGKGGSRDKGERENRGWGGARCQKLRFAAFQVGSEEAAQSSP